MTKHHPVKAVLSAVLLNLVLVAPSTADATVSQSSNGAPGMQMFELIPWFDSFEKKIIDQSAYKELVSEFTSDSSTHDITCLFGVNKNGDVIDPKIHFSSGSRNIDAKFLSLVKTAGPLSPPGNRLPIERGVEVTLAKITVGNKTFVSLSKGLNAFDDKTYIRK